MTVSPAATAAATAAQTVISTVESGAVSSFLTMVPALSAIGANLVGQTAQNFGVFVTNFTQDVEASPTTPGVYSASFKARWAQFVAAEEGNIDTDLAQAIKVVSNFLDNVLVQVSDAATAFAAAV